jgi:hypothetical protein
MSDLAKLYMSLFLAMPLSPILILAAAVAVSFRMKRGRWIVHIVAFAAMLLSMPLYLKGRGILDPTSIEYPGPGDGFGVLLWLMFLVPCLVGYGMYVWVPWKGVKTVKG